jgi:hypothetical protein
MELVPQAGTGVEPEREREFARDRGERSREARIGRRSGEDRSERGGMVRDWVRDGVGQIGIERVNQRRGEIGQEPGG